MEKDIETIKSEIARLKYQYTKADTVIEKQRFRKQISKLQAKLQKINKENEQ